MASDDSSGARPAAPIVIRIKLRYDDVEVMVQRFATNVGKSGLFLPTKSLQPIGAEIKFDLRLSDDTPVLLGLGRVKAATAPDPNNPKATFGMAIELMRVTPQSRALILRMLEQRRALGLPELGLPAAADIDAARRAEAASASVRDASVSGPLPAPPAPPASSEAPSPPPSAPGEALLTAPRRTTGPMAVAKVLAVAPLAPEPPRRKRVALQDLIESASGSVASVAAAVPGLDDEVDIAAAIVRARTLAGDVLDAELEALSEVVEATPRAISIQEASAELAKQLGGGTALRDHSARWAPPPVTAPAPAPVPSPPPAEAPVPDDAGEAAKADEPSSDPPLPNAPAPEDAEVEPAQTAGEIHQLHELDLEDGEHTELGEIPSAPGAFGPHGDPSEPSAADQARLAAADQALEPPADEAAPPPFDAGHEPGPEEFDDFEILAEADADDADLLAANGEQEASNSHIMLDRPRAMARPASEFDFAARLDLEDEGDMYIPLSPNEFAAHHAHDGVHEEFADRHAHDGLHGVFEDNPRIPPALLDSAGQALAAFDTGDESLDETGIETGIEPLEVTGDRSFDDPDEPRGRAPERVVQPIFDPEPSSSFTLAGVMTDPGDLEFPSMPGPDAAGANWPPRNPLAPGHREPAVPRHAPLPSVLHEAPMEDHELEHALQALDVDFDDLSIPEAISQVAPQLPHQPDPSKSRPTQILRPSSGRISGRPPAPVRPSTDGDDVVIELGDDE
jgi:hypothetical protein